MINLFKRRVVANSSIFNNHYVDARALYLCNYNRVPCVTYIIKLDVNKALEYINQHLGIEVTDIYRQSEFSVEEGKSFFNLMIMVLKDQRILEFGTDYLAILHNSADFAWANNLLRQLAEFRIVEEANERVIGFVRQPAMHQ